VSYQDDLDREERSLPFPDAGLVCPRCGNPPATVTRVGRPSEAWAVRWLVHCPGCGTLAPSRSNVSPGHAMVRYRRAVAAYILEHGDTFEQSSLAEDDREGWWPAVGATLATMVTMSLAFLGAALLFRYFLLLVGAFVSLLTL